MATRTPTGATLVFASVYGNTERTAEAVARGLSEGGRSRLAVHNMSRSASSYILNDVWQLEGLVLGGPSYNTRLFPLMDDFLRLLGNLRIAGRPLGVFGTYGWSKGAVAAMLDFAAAGKWNAIFPTVEAHCCATDQDTEACRRLGLNLAKAVRRKSAPG